LLEVASEIIAVTLLDVNGSVMVGINSRNQEIFGAD
jgi:hypothetical protein